MASDGELRAAKFRFVSRDNDYEPASYWRCLACGELVVMGDGDDAPVACPHCGATNEETNDE